MQRKSPKQSLSQREKVLWLKSKTIPSANCWEWQAGLHSQGYGRVSIWLHKSQAAHRAMFELVIGPADGKYVLHSCDNRKCINPEHLWLGSHIDNINDMIVKGRNVHKLSAESASQIKRFCSYNVSKQEIANAFGVSKRTVLQISNGETHAAA